MNIKHNSLGLLGVGIGIGAVLGLASPSPVEAGTLDREIVNASNDRMGRVTMVWNDDLVPDNNMLMGFGSLESFSLMEYGSGRTYDLDFALTSRSNDFKFDINTGWLEMYAYNNIRINRTRVQDGFLVESENPNPSQVFSITTNSQKTTATTAAINLANALQTNTYIAALNLSTSTTPEGNTSLKPPQPQDPQSVPESSLTTALLVIAGLIFLRPHKIF